MSPLRHSMMRWRSTTPVIFIIAIVIVLAGFWIIFENEATYRASREQQASTEAQVLAASVAAPVDFDDPVAAKQAIDSFKANPQARFVGVFDRSGNAMAAFDRTGRRLGLPIVRLPPANWSSLRVMVPVQSGGQRVGSVVYEVEREPVARRLARYVVMAALVVLAALVIVTLGLAQAALRRANRDLQDRAEALAQSNELLAEQMEQRAKAEEELRQSQKMKALGQLTGGIAHDFNNLLTVIQGSADVLCRDDLPDSKRKRFAQAIVQAASNAAVLTSQLLAFARRQPLRPETLNLNLLILEMTELISRTVSERIKVETDLAPNPCPVTVDRAQLQSAILNIVSNARDAIEGDGRITIRIREERSTAGEKMMALEFSDTGSGIDPEMMERVFEPFFTTKGPGKGTGLGLSQVYGFASQSGGDVAVTSSPGGGTTITLRLPCSESPEEQHFEEDQLGLEIAPASVLLVEDNPEVGAFAQTLLSELGHSVTLARSGEEALEVARSRRFDVVFSDIVMPGMGGLKLAEALAIEQPELPVVLATGYSQELAQSGTGGRAVILKPYRLATVAKALAAALRDRPAQA